MLNPLTAGTGRAPSLLGEMGADLGNAKWESCNCVIGTALFTQVHKCLICRQCVSDCLGHLRSN